MKLLSLAMALLLAAAGSVVAEPALKIDVHPAKITLGSARAGTQIIVTGRTANGVTRDLTTEAAYTVRDPILTVAEGRALPLKDGRTEITIRAEGQTFAIPVEISGLSNTDPVRFRTETLAVLTKQGCNSGSCHGSPEGKGGFALSLFGYDPVADSEQLVRGGLNRRLNLFEAGDSLLLKKPLMRVDHVGGKRLAKSDAAFAILRDWISQGAKTNDENQPACVRLVVTPGPSRVLATPHLSQQLSVVAEFADGTSRDVTAIATYDVSHKENLRVGDGGRVTGLKRGQGAVSVRYLNHLESVHFTIIEPVPGFQWNNPVEANIVDKHVHAKLRQLQILPSDTCDDATFLRRVSLDLTGLLPPHERTTAFLADVKPNKRATLIDELLASEEFARFWALRGADLMRVNPKTLPEGRAELLANWLIEGYRQNTPFDRVAREILAATGDASTVPAANYFLAIPNAEDLTETTAQLFMGSRVNCAKCHNHPFENWTQEDYYRISAVFARIKKSGKVLMVADAGEARLPSTGKTMIPYGPASADAKADRRVAFAGWLTKPGNPFFARVEVNRIWSQLFGRGIVHPVDDFRSSNPPAIPELIDALAGEFERGGYDRQAMIRLICNSRTYQRSAATNPTNESDETLFSHFPVRRLSAEQLLDGIGMTTGTLLTPAELKSATAVAQKEAADKPNDKNLQTSLKRFQDRAEYATQRLTPEQTEFLRAFGQPKRESPCACDRNDEPTVDQALQLLNGPVVTNRLGRGADIYGKLGDVELIQRLWLTALCRQPKPAEVERILPLLKNSTRRADTVKDILWVVINTREFLLQH